MLLAPSGASCSLFTPHSLLSVRSRLPNCYIAIFLICSLFTAFTVYCLSSPFTVYPNFLPCALRHAPFPYPPCALRLGPCALFVHFFPSHHNLCILLQHQPIFGLFYQNKFSLFLSFHFLELFAYSLKPQTAKRLAPLLLHPKDGDMAATGNMQLATCDLSPATCDLFYSLNC
jgi:hypothetical protein